MYALAVKVYVPKGFDITAADMSTIRFFMKMIPAGAFILVLSGYGIGALLGGFVSALVSGKIIHPVLAGAGLLMAGIFNLLILPHPAWFAIVSLILFLPVAFLGGKIGLAIRK